MGVYIKGIKMPTNCESCPCKTTEAFGGLGCQATGYIPLRKADQERPDNCPLIYVPPHGQLKDADALLKKCEFICTDDDVDVRAVRYSIIDAAPIIIPAELSKEKS